MPEPVVETCRNPAKTRRDAMAGGPVPCGRCLAFRPDTETGCHFLEIRPARAKPVSPKRSTPTEQRKLWG